MSTERWDGTVVWTWGWTQKGTPEPALKRGICCPSCQNTTSSYRPSASQPRFNHKTRPSLSSPSQQLMETGVWAWPCSPKTTGLMDRYTPSPLSWLRCHQSASHLDFFFCPICFLPCLLKVSTPNKHLPDSMQSLLPESLTCIRWEQG
jgi:hypothetical protein